MMNDWRLLCCLSLCPMILPATAHGYANDGSDGGPHRKINQFALEAFLDKAKQDPILSRYDFAPTVVGYDLPARSLREDKKENPFTVEYDAVIRSGAWAKEDKIKSYPGFATLDWEDYAEEAPRRSPFRWWIIEGGYSADEPEAYMSMRHFYDPTNASTPYLTDLIGKPLPPSGAKNWLTSEPLRAGEGGQHIALMGDNPRVAACDWGLLGSQHALQDATKNLTAARGPASPEAEPADREKLFGQAWRSIGESMHLLADMTVPAHVRNDGHPGVNSKIARFLSNFSAQYDLRSDPYEDYVTGGVVMRHAQDPVEDGIVRSIQEASSPRVLFDRVALYTNSHFTSEDTLSGIDPQGNKISPHNGQPAYPLPKLDPGHFELLGEDTTAYYSRDDSLGSVCLAAAVRDDSMLTKRRRVFIDRKCADSQASRLIPLAIAADERLLEFAIPRVGIVVDGLDAQNKTLKCHAVHFDADKKGGYDARFPILSKGLPTTRDRALIRLTAGGKTQYFWQKIASVQGGNFEVSLEYIPSIQLTEILDYNPSNPPSNELQLAAGIDMGGIAVWSEDFTPPALAVSPDEAETDVSGSLSFRAESKGLKAKDVLWSVSETNGGGITPDGTYTAPDTPGTFHVEAALKDNPTVTARAKVKVNPSAGEQPKTAGDDIGWKELAQRIGLSSDAPLGSVKYGFEFYGKEAKDATGQPYIAGWCKVIKTGSVMQSLGNGNSKTAPYWICLVPEVKIWAPGNGPLNLSPEGQHIVTAKDEKYYTEWWWGGGVIKTVDIQHGRLGDVSVSGLGEEHGRFSALRDAWRGPLQITVIVGAQIRVSAGFYNLSKGFTYPNIPQEAIDSAIESVIPTADALAADLMADIDRWYFNPIASGPGIKGLYYPLWPEKYMLTQEDLPANFVPEDYIAKGWDYWWRKYHGPRDPKNPAGYEDYMVGVESDDMRFNEDDKAGTPLLRAHQRIEKKTAEVYGTKDFDAPVKISLPGADEAVELKPTTKSKFFKGQVQNHAIIFRRLNVVGYVKARFISDEYVPQSPYAYKLIRSVMTKLVGKKPAAPAPHAAQARPAAPPAQQPAHQTLSEQELNILKRMGIGGTTE